eukprot:13128756-Alexandrium_andersonii.AAC.1
MGFARALLPMPPFACFTIARELAFRGGVALACRKASSSRPLGAVKGSDCLLYTSDAADDM